MNQTDILYQPAYLLFCIDVLRQHNEKLQKKFQTNTWISVPDKDKSDDEDQETLESEQFQRSIPDDKQAQAVILCRLMEHSLSALDAILSGVVLTELDIESLKSTHQRFLTQHIELVKKKSLSYSKLIPLVKYTSLLEHLQQNFLTRPIEIEHSLKQIKKLSGIIQLCNIGILILASSALFFLPMVPLVIATLGLLSMSFIALTSLTFTQKKFISERQYCFFMEQYCSDKMSLNTLNIIENEVLKDCSIAQYKILEKTNFRQMFFDLEEPYCIQDDELNENASRL